MSLKNTIAKNDRGRCERAHKHLATLGQMIETFDHSSKFAESHDLKLKFHMSPSPLLKIKLDKPDF